MTILVNKQRLNFINGVKARVLHIYTRYQEAVDSDKVLEDKYHKLFEPEKNPLELPLASIRRCGRFWRKTQPLKFERSLTKEEESKQMEEVCRIAFNYGKDKA